MHFIQQGSIFLLFFNEASWKLFQDKKMCGYYKLHFVLKISIFCHDKFITALNILKNYYILAFSNKNLKTTAQRLGEEE